MEDETANVRDFSEEDRGQFGRIRQGKPQEALNTYLRLSRGGGVDLLLGFALVAAGGLVGYAVQKHANIRVFRMPVLPSIGGMIMIAAGVWMGQGLCVRTSLVSGGTAMVFGGLVSPE